MREEDLVKALAGLQLPHMPPDLSGAWKQRQQGREQQQQLSPSRDSPDLPELPTIRVLVVADIDLSSAANLAEFWLQQKNQLFDASRVDLCIACGPFCRDDDVRPYQTSSKLRNNHNCNNHSNTATNNNNTRRGSGFSSANHHHHSTNHHSHVPSIHNQHNQHNHHSSSGMSDIPNQTSTAVAREEFKQRLATLTTPFVRTREETAGLEGLMTASLSQLESIVCRVVYCPGCSDPITTLLSNSAISAAASSSAGRRGSSYASHRSPTNNNYRSSSNTVTSTSGAATGNRKQQRGVRRLTPNSRNIHQQWLPLAPALGCTGLLYLELPEQAEEWVMKRQRTAAHLRRSRRPSTYRGGHNSSEDLQLTEDSEDDLSAVGPPSEDEMGRLTEQLLNVQKSRHGYLSTLSELLRLAPRPSHPVPFASSRYSQSILVTHYMDLTALGTVADDELEGLQPLDNSNANTSLGEIIHGESTLYDKAIKNRISINGGCRTPSGTWASGWEKLWNPWPVPEHEAFLASSQAQELLCLEIASGGGNSLVWDDADTNLANVFPNKDRRLPQPAQVRRKGGTCVLLPGSLRQRGEFTLVDLSVVPTQPPQSNTSEIPNFSWQVTNVDIFNLNDLP